MEALMLSVLAPETGLGFGIQYFLLGKETFPRHLLQPAVGNQGSHTSHLVHQPMQLEESGAEALG